MNVEIDVANHKPLTVQILRTIPLPHRLQGAGMLKLHAFTNASDEIIIVLADRTGASMFAPHRSNFNEGCLWVTRYDEKSLEVVSVTSRFAGRKPKELVFLHPHLYMKVNDNDWIDWTVDKQIDPVAENHLRHLFRTLYGVSEEDCHGWLAPHVNGEVDETLFTHLTNVVKPLFSLPSPSESRFDDIDEDVTDEADLDLFADLLGDDDFEAHLPSWLL